MNEPTLESLRAAGAQHCDPVRFRYLEVLAARLPGQPPAVQQVLAARLQAAMEDYARLAQSTPPRQPPQALPGTSPSPLALLNQELQARAQADADPALGEDADSPAELPSVRRFGEVWAKIAAEQQVDRAFTRGPENAGPLNPHRLMLRSLALMRTLSPDYLRHFVAQVDSLLWLEQASARPVRAPARSGRGARARS